jgi:hypothetical protein
MTGAAYVPSQAGFLGEHFGVPRALAASGVACLLGALVFGFCLPTLKLIQEWHKF